MTIENEILQRLVALESDTKHILVAISGALIGKRQRLEDQLDALPADATPEQVATIVW